MIKELIKRIIFVITGWAFFIKRVSTPNLTQKGKIFYFRSRIRLHKSAKLEIGENVKLINSSITIGSGSKVSIGPNCWLKNANLNIGENSFVNFEEGVVIRNADKDKSFDISQGTLIIEKFANLIAVSISVRFNGRLRIGTYSGIGFDSEITCDESIDIGQYCLISNNVDIFDTNSHSTDYLKRRERIEIGYPEGCSEIERPKTKPVKVGDDVWIGKKSQILKGTVIGERSIVGLGTKVTPGTYPANSLIVGQKSSFLESKTR